IELAQTYKQLNAPLGSVGRNSLVYANRSIISDDVTYGKYLTKIGDITARRDALANEIKSALNAAAFGNKSVGERNGDELAEQARKIIDQLEDLVESRKLGFHDDDHGHDRDR